MRAKSAPSGCNRAIARRIDTAIAIAGDKPTGDEIAFLHIAWTQLVLPRTKWAGPEYSARCGDAELLVRAGYVNVNGSMTRASVPSGAMARLALYQISTYVTRHKAREVPIGDSAARWIRSIAASSSGPHMRRARETMLNVAAADITVGWRGKTHYLRAVDEVGEWHFGRGGTAWPSSIRVSRDFAEAVMEKPVPVDQRTLIELRDSALAMDIYVWLAYRLYRVPDKGAFVPWRSIEQQFAIGGLQAVEGYRGGWRRMFRKALSRVQTYYAANRLVELEHGFHLKRTQPPVRLSR